MKESDFGLSVVKKEGGCISIDPDAIVEATPVPSSWMELHLYHFMTEDEVIAAVKKWLKENNWGNK